MARSASKWGIITASTRHKHLRVSLAAAMRGDTPMKTYQGACQCGAIKYEASAEPLMIYACHCTICQTQSGSAFGLAAAFASDAIAWSGIEPQHFERPGHGRKCRCYFCPRCGTRLYHQWFTDEGDYPFVSIKPGTLDDTSWIRPGCHVWTQHAQPWVRFAEDEVVFAQQSSLDEMPKFKGA